MNKILPVNCKFIRAYISNLIRPNPNLNF